MLTLINYQISKRIRFSVGIIIGMILMNMLFTGLIEICTNNSKNQYEGYNIAFTISMSVIILVHIISIKKDFYDVNGEMLFSFPIRGYGIVLARLIILLIDVFLVVIL